MSASILMFKGALKLKTVKSVIHVHVVKSLVFRKKHFKLIFKSRNLANCFWIVMWTKVLTSIQIYNISFFHGSG